ncbi:MAG: M28 family peptidase [Acidobacteria bacterium]|nr:MAG: M28 family peptidase [Acidobacteriota bacterium]
MRETPSHVLVRGSILALAALSLAAYMALTAVEPPQPSSEDAPATTFSARRAMRLVEELGRRPRPLGSAEHQRVREVLTAELASLGLEPQIQRTVAARQRGRLLVAAQVENVLARLPGTTGRGAVLLMAHYDTRSTTPGAADDMTGVATILETVRALRAGPQLANDVIVLLTDAEEPGLLGARAFAAEHPWMADVSLVLNFEARGSGGVSMMFETAGANEGLARALRRAAPYPFASSASVEIYRRMPNDTDFTVFRQAGVMGLNFSFIDDLPAYHTTLDAPERLDLRSLQHHGSYALALSRHFGDLDLEQLAAASRSDAVYFNPFGWAMAIYPLAWAVPLALLAAAAFAFAVVLGLRRGVLRRRGLVRAVAAAFAVLALVPLIAQAGWWAFSRAAAGLLLTPHGMPYDQGLVSLALGLLALAPAAWILGRARRHASTLELTAGGLVPWSLAAVATAVAMPGTSFLFLWPLVAMLLALGYGVARGRRRTAAAQLAVLALGGLPAVALVVPLLHLIGLAVTLRLAAALGVLFAFLLLLLGGLIAPLGWRGRWLPATAAGGALLLLAAVVARGGYDAQRPRIDSLFYSYDAEAKEALWLSFDRRPDAWTEAVLQAGERAPAPSYLPFAPGTTLLASTAPVAPLPYPRVELIQDLADASGAGRSLSLFAISPRRAPVLWLRARCASGIRGVWLDGEHYPLADDGDGAPVVLLRFFGLPTAGLALTLELAGDAPVEVAAVDQSWQLPAVAAAPALPRPPSIIPSTSWFTDSTLVHQSFAF